jgi:hypothetical protein
MPGHFRVEPEQLLAKRKGTSLRETESHVVAEGTNVRDMVVDAF